ncbi:MAG: hypothetical protein HYX59_06475 [Elusimicrobia bacterium]|nr:hypothetical protein [Elusimicrobiota bacterium]
MLDKNSETEAPRCNGTARPPLRRLGRDGLAYAQELLGGPPSGWSLEKAALRGSALEFSLVKDSRRLEFRAERGPAGGTRLDRLGRGDEPADDERALASALAAGLAATEFAGALARLSRDALHYCDSSGGSVPSRFERYYRVVDHSAGWWRFVHPETRFLEQEVRFGRRYAQISHATLECNLNNPKLEVAPLRFFAGDERPRSAEGDYSYHDTDLGEADVVGGRTQEILGQALDKVAREEKPAFIHLKTTCLPELVGDTPVPFMARIESELGVPVLWTSKTHDSGPVYEGMVERLLGEIEFSAVRDPRAVLLAGVPSALALEEAAELCAEAGLRVAGSVFPNLDFDASPEMRSASAVVWYDPVGWAKIDDGAFLRRGLRVVRFHPPYGLAGTRAWLRRIGSVLGLEGAGAGDPPSLRAAAADFEALAVRCRRRTVALAGDAADVELLTSSGRAFGFSVAGLLCELGFNVRCLVHTTARGAAARALVRPRTASGAGTIEFRPFSSRAALDRQLGRGVDLAFTHFNHDPRLEAHGLRGFNDRAFEPGLDGLLRTGRALLRRCESRPFPRHRDGLAPWAS